METPAIREWFRGFTPVTKLGMWWYLNHTNLGYFVCLHGSKGTPPLIDSFDELILWISNEAEALVVGGQGRITNKNLTVLDYSTLPATTPQ